MGSEMCIRDSNRGCGKIPLIPDQSSLGTDYVQTIYMGEPLEVAKHNTPISFTGRIYGDLVGDVFIGQKKRVTGVFQTIIDPKKDTHDIRIDVISIEEMVPKPETIAVAAAAVLDSCEMNITLFWKLNALESIFSFCESNIGLKVST